LVLQDPRRRGLSSRTTTLVVCVDTKVHVMEKQESRAVAREPRDAAAVLFGLHVKFADNIHYKFKSSQASKAGLQSSRHTGVKKASTCITSADQNALYLTVLMPVSK